MGNKKYKGLFNIPRCWPDELDRKFAGKSKKIFVNSMSDIFHKDIPFEFIKKVWDYISQNPQHFFQILTKRPGRMFEFSQWVGDEDGTATETWPQNAWLGITAENWNELPHRSWYLNELHAAVKFISMEPLLDDISQRNPKDFKYYLSHFDWVIVGAETGPKARFMDPQWARNVRDVCRDLKIPFFFKKMSNNQPVPDDLMIREFPEPRKLQKRSA